MRKHKIIENQYGRMGLMVSGLKIATKGWFRK